MMAVLLIAGIGVLLAGLLGIVFGIPVKEFSFGNTLILTGAIGACTGMIMLGLWMVVRELKNIARQLGPDSAQSDNGAIGSTALKANLNAGLGDPARVEASFPFSRGQPADQKAGNGESAAPSSPPWREEAAARDRSRNDPLAQPVPPEPFEAAPAVKPRRNLLFSSSLRKERERTQARTAEPSATDTAPIVAPRSSEIADVQPVVFDDAWPKSQRSKAAETPLPRRSARVPSTFTATTAAAAERHPAATLDEKQQPPPVTVLKSGAVDGMAYSLYSDGSIEAQMPEGMMRFASIDELRAHLEQRP
jgi:hypothetical protein